MATVMRRTYREVLVVGDSGYIHKEFSVQYKSTQKDTEMKKEFVDKDRLVSLEMWDTSGNDDDLFCADCCVLVYDVNDKSSFDSLDSWRKRLLDQNWDIDRTKFPFILLGNKIDIDGGNSRSVSEKSAQDWCAAIGDIPYFETSAKEDYNVDAAFLSAAKEDMFM
ncbi:Ras-related protein Rab7 [Carex littledalei]|uniref:Ras-related protein Rab7 n=1 Tax=Carex littledalei TaxID=544730 RepID=A0A833QH29_9POAL|nr:Ras-related protein Rab7 [Carex littledalei]